MKDMYKESLKTYTTEIEEGEKTSQGWAKSIPSYWKQSIDSTQSQSKLQLHSAQKLKNISPKFM